MAKEKISPFIVALIIGITVVLALSLFSHSTLYKRFTYSAEDFRWNYCVQKDLADKNMVIVAIDDYAIKEFSEKFNYPWPWPRQFYGIILDYFKQAQARSVVFDILFSQSEVGRLDIDGTVSEQAFADAMKSYGRAVLGENLSDDLNPNNQSRPSQELMFEHAEKMPAREYRSVESLIPSFSQSSAAIGVVNFHSDEDGVCRRMPLVFKVNGTYRPQLSLAAYLVAADDALVSYDEKKRELVTRKKRFHLDKNGYYPIYWYGEGGGQGGVYRYDSFYNVFISATQVMSGENPVIPLTDFKDKNILICATASGLMDLKATPFSSTDAPYPGGEIHTTLFDNLLNDRSIKEDSDIWVILGSLVCMILLGYMFLTRSLGLSLGLALVLCVFAVGTSFYLFGNHMIHVDFIFPVFAVFLTSASSAMYKMLTEGQKKRQIRSIFSRYLHEDVINLLMENPDRVDLEGTELVGTVLFTDLQGFTTFAEDKSPQTLIDVLNRYFETVTNIVLDQKGMLDKYTGDGIMAIFGAPIAREGHAKSACEVILAFRDNGVNDLISSEGPKILTRIGISTGPIVVGNLGSKRRMDFTAIGDTVNLSARLEGVNKAYGTTNIMSEFTWEFVKDDYYFRELDFIRVKGKNKPIRVFTLVDRKEAMTKEALGIEEQFLTAIACYRKRKWEDAIALFEKVLELNPGDPPSISYIERCKLLQTNPDLVDEHGVFTFKTK
ncbi:MAG: CHASE2 domain-containing protein [Proteobacteria bacterium]|nr:CHASE2 domain-containing protein [Pseudomonadota bacterium]